MVDKKIKQNQYSEILILEIIFSFQDSSNVIVLFESTLNKLLIYGNDQSVYFFDMQNRNERWKIHSCFFNISYVKQNVHS